MRLLAIIALFALAGCGSSSSSSDSSGAGGRQLMLSESEFKITPANPTVAQAGTITITVKNAGTVTHALSVQTPSGTVSTANIAPGASATLTVNATKAGKYTFFCPIPGHRQAGMQGVLTVGAASAGAITTTVTPYAPKTYQPSGY